MEQGTNDLHMVHLMPYDICFGIIQNVYPSGTGLQYSGCPGKRPLNECFCFFGEELFIAEWQSYKMFQ